MKIVNMPRGAGKTKLIAEWVLKNTHKRAVLVGTKHQQMALERLEVPEQNIILVVSKRQLEYIENFEEIGVDEVNQVLNNLLNNKLKVITLTAGDEK